MYWDIKEQSLEAVALRLSRRDRVGGGSRKNKMQKMDEKILEWTLEYVHGSCEKQQKGPAKWLSG